MDEDPCGNNRNKRKFEDEILEVHVAKHACLSTQSHIQLDIVSNNISAKDSNNFSDDANSVISVSMLHMSPHDAPNLTSSSSSSSSSVNWNATSNTKTCDASNLYTFPTFEDSDVSSTEYETKQSEEASMEDMFCSNGILPNNSVLSSGRWNVNQDTEQGTEKLTIDKEFEQYFSMLML